MKSESMEQSAGVGQFWTPIMAVGGSLLHADLQIKQHLRIKSFYGTSINAVKSQIWVALCTYLLVAIAKKNLAMECSLYTFLQIIEVNLFEKKLISSMVAEALKRNPDPLASDQLILFEN